MISPACSALLGRGSLRLVLLTRKGLVLILILISGGVVSETFHVAPFFSLTIITN